MSWQSFAPCFWVGELKCINDGKWNRVIRCSKSWLASVYLSLLLVTLTVRTWALRLEEALPGPGMFSCFHITHDASRVHISDFWSTLEAQPCLCVSRPTAPLWFPRTYLLCCSDVGSSINQAILSVLSLTKSQEQIPHLPGTEYRRDLLTGALNSFLLWVPTTHCNILTSTNTPQMWRPNE